ncbi:hypothetical protein GCM10022252_67310 [Streptosporangium oxazolinicum]|uniref:Uncharacterized protein n=1 Tax=Streptosporangium oxazolinicum TaxID=909287 RepID=A0ABP8BG78_9ACTN
MSTGIARAAHPILSSPDATRALSALSALVTYLPSSGRTPESPEGPRETAGARWNDRRYQ